MSAPLSVWEPLATCCVPEATGSVVALPLVEVTSETVPPGVELSPPVTASVVSWISDVVDESVAGAGSDGVDEAGAGELLFASVVGV